MRMLFRQVVYELLAGERQAALCLAFTEENDGPNAAKVSDWLRAQKPH